MAVTLLSNIASQRAQRTLASATEQAREVSERLSTGLRINRAGDDAAGLSIAATLNSNAKVFTQGIRNLNDGISLIAIADGAMAELSDIVGRLRELAAQSANGVYSNEQRRTLDNEGKSLVAEFNRIIDSTRFNGLGLLDGSVERLTIQAGFSTLDIVLGKLGTGSVTGGDGTFEAQGATAAGNATAALAAGDVNGDGIVDLVTTGVFDFQARVFLGQENGTYVQGETFAIGHAWDVKLLDLDGDQRLDIVAPDNSGELIKVFLGNGDGTFAAQPDLDAEVPFDISYGDFDGDGNIDLVTANNSTLAGLSVFLGNGDGTFQARTDYTAFDAAYGIAVSDFNGDSLPDLAVADRTNNQLGILLGEFTEASVPVFVATGTTPRAVKSADFDNDGDMDLAVLEKGDSTLTIFLNDGAGTFTAGNSMTIEAGDAFTVGDFDTNGAIDIAYVGDNNSLNFLFNDGSGSFTSGASYATGARPRDVISVDLDGDSALDLVTANHDDDSFSIFKGNLHTVEFAGRLEEFDLTTAESARLALDRLRNVTAALASERGQLGAFESRIHSARNHLDALRSAMQKAEANIRDTDVASDTAMSVRLQIQQEATAAVLGQANQQPAHALQLL